MTRPVLLLALVAAAAACGWLAGRHVVPVPDPWAEWSSWGERP